MATSQSQKALYAPGEDLESIAANQAYQDALAKLTKSLDVRKNRLFDPVLLSIAEGFLGPTQTGSFGEALGRVAGKIGPAEAAAAKERQDIAAFELDLASKGIELQRQKARDAMVRRFLSGEEGPSAGALPTSSRAEAGEPSGARPAQGALAQAQGAPGREMGIQIAPGTPGISRQQFFSLGLADGKNISDIAKDWEAIQRGRLQSKENYMINTGTGMAYLLPSADLVQVQIFNRDGSPPKTYPVTKNQAIRLSELAEKGDSEGYFDLADRITRGPQPSARPVAPAASQQPAVPSLQQPGASAGSTPAPITPVPDVRPPPVPAQAAAPSSDRVFPEPGSQVARVQEFINQRIMGQIPEARVETPAQASPSAAAQTAAPPVAARPAPVAVPPAAVPPTQAAAVAADVPSAVAPSAPGRAAAAGATNRAGLMSVQESESIKAREKALQEADVQMEIESRKDFNQRFRDAGDSITMANMLRRFSEDPNASKMTGILNNEKISSGIARLVRDGVGARDFRIGIPAIEDVMRNAGLSPADQAKYRVFLMNTAQMRLQMSKYMKGSVSNYEQELMGEAAVSSQDTPQTIRMKADLLARRAQFDRKVYRAFKAAKMTAEEFLDSDQYEKMRDEYDEQLTRISVGELRYQPSTSNPATNAPARGAPRAAVPGAGQPSPGFIRDPQTGMIRRKRPGE